MMKLSVSALEQCGGFAGGAIEKTVEWEQDGEALKAQVFVRPMSYNTAIDIGPNDSKETIVLRRIVRCICDETGGPIFSMKDLTGFDEDGKPVMVKRNGAMVERGPVNLSLINALSSLVIEVSGLGKPKKATDSV